LALRLLQFRNQALGDLLHLIRHHRIMLPAVQPGLDIGEELGTLLARRRAPVVRIGDPSQDPRLPCRRPRRHPDLPFAQLATHRNAAAR
jgi:hypothetical protein